MLIDEAFITVMGGKGGTGSATFFPNKSGPCGGDGGRGGNVYVKVNRSITSLIKYAKQNRYEGERGGDGGSFNRTGAEGADLILEFPSGTELVEPSTGKIVVLPENGQKLLICSGGRGGWGNDHFKSPTNQTPRHFEPGYIGEKRIFKVIMRLIAQIGLIGLPNAGKSSLLNALTKTQVKTANYPFTTLEPNLGALGKTIIADIPGLIEGASSGKGLGTRFLKHIEKVTTLLHCISCEVDTKTMKKNYITVRKELESYNKTLLQKKEIVLLTKSDLILPKQRAAKIKFFESITKDVFCISVHDGDALEKLSKLLIGY